MSETEARCTVRVAGDSRWPTFHDCGRRLKPGYDQCGLHVAAAKRRTDAEAARKAHREAQQARADHLNELGQRLLKQHDVHVWAHYAYGGGMDGNLVISEEDLLKLVRCD